MGVFILFLGIFIYYIAVYFLEKLTLKAFHMKHELPWWIGGGIFFSIPMFCILDYIFRGHTFIEFFVIPGYLIWAFLIYYIFSVLGVVFIRFVICFVKKKRVVWYDKLSIILATFGSFIFCLTGILCAKIPEYTRIDLKYNLKESLKIVAVSDIHYASSGSMLSLDKMVQNINQEHPDLVLLIGDVFDNFIQRINHQEFVDKMNQITSTYGIYAVTGNHEFMLNNLEEIKSFYKDTNIKLLLDEEVIINDQIRIVGRIDHRAGRKDLQDITSNSTLPLIVLDHQPQYYRDAIRVKAKLQISGHTHNGQIFPGNFLVFVLNQWVYNSPSDGLNTYGDFTLSITRGYGTWGFPMRLTGPSQIMVYNLT